MTLLSCMRHDNSKYPHNIIENLRYTNMHLNVGHQLLDLVAPHSTVTMEDILHCCSLTLGDTFTLVLLAY